MKRKGNLYWKISLYDNLCHAFNKAAKGKQKHAEVVEFKKNFNENINCLILQLKNYEPDIGHYRFFRVHDPKLRSICAASFKEKVLHHAIMNICEPVLESYSIYDSYACRIGKGTRKAINRALKFSRATKWYLKLDIKKYFDSIDHKITLKLLERQFKEKRLIDLFEKLLNTYHTKKGKGVPIGNLISQHLANFYLGSFDHWIKEERKISYYIRYMDDFIIFGKYKSQLKTELEEIRYFLKTKLELDLKSNIQLNRNTHGITFLGYRVFPNKILLSKQSQKRFVKKFRKYEAHWINGQWGIHDLIRHMEPLIDFTKGAGSNGFRSYVIERFGVSS